MGGQLSSSDEALMPNPLAALTSGAIQSPFSQLRSLLAGIPSGHVKPIELTIGEGQGSGRAVQIRNNAPSGSRTATRTT